MLKVLIADAAEDFRVALTDALKSKYIVKSCDNGDAALELAGSFCPDLLILDLMISGVDGLSLVQMIAQFRGKPLILATTRFQSPYVLEAATRVGIDYMVVKPCSIRALVDRVEDLAGSRDPGAKPQSDPRVAVANLLLAMNFIASNKGYTYLREAIPLYAKDPQQAMTKELYPEVGKIHRVSGAQVEKAIRSAINSAWKMRDDQVWRMYFPPGPDGRVARPTNSVFITRLADCLMSGAEYGEKWLDKESSEWYYMH